MKLAKKKVLLFQMAWNLHFSAIHSASLRLMHLSEDALLFWSSSHNGMRDS